MSVCPFVLSHPRVAQIMDGYPSRTFSAAHFQEKNFSRGN